MKRIHKVCILAVAVLVLGVFSLSSFRSMANTASLENQTIAESQQVMLVVENVNFNQFASLVSDPLANNATVNASNSIGQSHFLSGEPTFVTCAIPSAICSGGWLFSG